LRDGAGLVLFFFSSRRRHTRFSRDWSSDVCSSDLPTTIKPAFWYSRSVRVKFTARATGILAAVPALVRHATAVSPALRRCGTTTPCAPNAAADLITAPRLRG